MPYNMPWEDMIAALRDKAAGVWGVTGIIPMVTPTYHWLLTEDDVFPMALLEIPGRIEFTVDNAIHDLDEHFPFRLWHLDQYPGGTDVPSVQLSKVRAMAQSLYADRSLGNLVNKLDLKSGDITGRGAEWPVENLELMEDLAACYVEGELLLVESRV